jgi:hypothetical protein
MTRGPVKRLWAAEVFRTARTGFKTIPAEIGDTAFSPAGPHPDLFLAVTGFDGFIMFRLD